MLTLPNYQVTEQIYESTNSTIYRGIRNEDNQPVILKMLKQDYPTPAELNRCQQEYEIISNFNSTKIIKAYGIEKYQKTLIIILEDFGGESLKQLMVDRPFNLNEFLPFAIKTVESLSNIHAASIIHKDINPSNIIWEPVTKQVKIIDFGIASRLLRENPSLKNPEQLEGTLPYISPEQTGRINRSIDYRTDLYSLGITFYEMLTGKLPFDTNDAMELVHCHIAKIPIPIYEINPDIPQIVSDIVMKLLVKNAEDRYQSTFGLKTDLERCQLSSSQFELAQQDFSGQFQIPQKLYGRENEVHILLQAFERISDGTAEMMLVAGYSGVGKTALVHEVHKPMTEKRGYFAAGKFDQFQRNIPYSAITQVFNEFCSYLLTESADQLLQWKTTILNAVKNNGQVLIDVIPHLELVIGQQPTVAQVSLTEAQNRFNLVFQHFFHAIVKEYPLILFIDDLQWADSASLNLLSSLMTNTNNQYFLLIGAYRDNEVDATHPLMTMVEDIKKTGAVINKIVLQNLSKQDVNILLADSLSCELLCAKQLTDLVYQKTQGNAFFTHEFLKALYEQNLLEFDTDEQQWQWDVNQVKAVGMTDNVVELMTGKIEKLPLATQAVLKLASCIGNQFDLKTLSIICQQSVNDTLKSLLEAIDLIFHQSINYERVEMLVITDEVEAYFKFQHDRIQQAAYLLITDIDKPSIHLQIGRLLKTNVSDIEERLFEIVDHLNLGIAVVTTVAEQHEILQLNLQAGQKAKASAAYVTAIKYFHVGLECLDQESWNTDYELTLQLYVETAEAEYLNTNYQQAEVLIQVILQQAKTVLDKVRAYDTQMQMLIAQNQMQNSIESGLQVLKMLGVTLSDSPPEKREMADFYKLPNMSDPSKLAAMPILMTLFAPAVIARPTLLSPIAFTMVDLCLNSGNSSLSAFAYDFYGTLLCGALGDVETGYQFGKLALDMLEIYQARETKSKVDNLYYAFIVHWKEHPRVSIEPLRNAVQVGLETGDIEFACYNAVNYCFTLFLSGEPLKSVNEKQTPYLNLIQSLKQEFQLYYAKIWGQLVHNLSDLAPDKHLLIGSIFDESVMLPILHKNNNFTSLFCAYIAKTILCYLFKDYQGAINNAALAEQHESAMVGLMPVGQRPFYHSLALLAKYSTASDREQTEFLAKIEINQQKIAVWASHAPMNYQHKYDLVEAEKARVLGKLEAIELYERAIQGAKKNDYIQEEAIAYELAAEFYLTRDMIQFAQIYMKEAHYLYLQWGAKAKTEDLEAKYSQLFIVQQYSDLLKTTINSSVTQASTRFQTSTVLDLESVTKAAQTLAGEIVLSTLLEKIMRIVIENAGAERGLLILKQDDAWVIEAEGILDVDEVTILQSIPLEGYLPTSIVNYVARSLEPVLLSNAMQEGIYTKDSYIIQHQLKSVLCSPILHQGQLIGVLYVENNLIEGAFSPARLKMIDIFSSQAAISLDNALLYRTLEDKVERRTGQLATANQKITLLNDRLKQENVRMGAELDVAKQLQQMVLPKEAELQQIDSLDIAGFMEPAEEVGGDYYEVLNHDGHIKIGIGDVTGHGLESGVLMLMVQTTVRALLLAGIDDPEQFLNIVNRTIYHNAQRMETDKNLTLSLLDYQSKTLTITGQHEEILLVRKGGKIEKIDTFNLGFSIGIVADINEFSSHQEISLQSGDGIVLYTDGITEAQNISNKQYGLERLCKVVSDNWSGSSKEIQQTVIVDVKSYIGQKKVLDDITLLVLKQR